MQPRPEGTLLPGLPEEFEMLVCAAIKFLLLLLDLGADARTQRPLHTASIHHETLPPGTAAAFDRAASRPSR